MVANQVLLEPEQRDFLSALVEASRNVPRGQRQKFRVIGSYRGIEHPGLPGGSTQAYFGDVEILAKADLLNLTYTKGPFDIVIPMFDVAPQGFAYYKEMKLGAEAIQQVQTEVRSYLDAHLFRERYPVAYQKWADAEAKLWGSDSQEHLTTIGHLCREAMQEFATALVERYRPPKVPEDKKHVVARVRAVLDQLADRMGTTVKPFLDALVAYWGTLSDLVQRQEHGAEREKEPLVWEDARRLIFQTAVVMFEIDRRLSSLR